MAGPQRDEPTPGSIPLTLQEDEYAELLQRFHDLGGKSEFNYVLDEAARIVLWSQLGGHVGSIVMALSQLAKQKFRGKPEEEQRQILWFLMSPELTNLLAEQPGVPKKLRAGEAKLLEFMWVAGGMLTEAQILEQHLSMETLVPLIEQGTVFEVSRGKFGFSNANITRLMLPLLHPRPSIRAPW